MSDIVSHNWGGLSRLWLHFVYIVTLLSDHIAAYKGVTFCTFIFRNGPLSRHSRFFKMSSKYQLFDATLLQLALHLLRRS